MKHSVFVLVLLVLFSCQDEKEFVPRDINSVKIETVMQDSLLSIRAIQLLNDGNLAFAGNNNTYGLYNVKTHSLLKSKQVFDSLNLEFRAVAQTAQDFFMLSVGSPALLYKTGDTGNMELVYQDNHPKAFYNAMRFWNNNEGIAIGDPTNDCMSIIITRNGGKSWSKLSCENLPKILDGEAAFAASNTNIAIVGNHSWVATGGKASRVLYSPDKGKTWEVYSTPIVQGLATTGLYSIDFYDALNGFGIGGDYTQPDNNTANKIRTSDGGKTWELVAPDKNPNYRSCVQYIPNRKGKELVAIGFKGIDYSSDSGSTWKNLSPEGFYTIRFVNDSVAYAAGSGRISKLTFSE